MTIRVKNPQARPVVEPARACAGLTKTVELHSRQRNAGRGFSAVRPKVVNTECGLTTYWSALFVAFSPVWRSLSVAQLLRGGFAGLLLRLVFGLSAYSQSSLARVISHPVSSIADWFRGVSPRKAAVAVAWSVGAFGAQVSHAQSIQESLQYQAVPAISDVASCVVDTVSQVPCLSGSLDSGSLLSVDAEFRVAPAMAVRYSLGRVSAPARLSSRYVIASPRAPPSLAQNDECRSQRALGSVWQIKELDKVGHALCADFSRFSVVQNFLNRKFVAAKPVGLGREQFAVFSLVARS